MTEQQAAGFVIAAHAMFWTAIGIRLLMSRLGRRVPAEPNQKPVRSPRRMAVLALVTVTMGSFYLLFASWRENPARTGPLLLPAVFPVQVIGVATVLLSILLMIWCFRVLRNWRLRAQIHPGDQLITSGPYSVVQHPIYTAIILFYFGSWLLLPHLWFLVQAIANAIAYNVRARAEEAVLHEAFGNEYEV